MPFYHALGISSQPTGWTTTTSSSTTSSYLNPFYGATGGTTATTTSGCANTTGLMWVGTTTSTALPFNEPDPELLQFAQYQQDQREMLRAYQQADEQQQISAYQRHLSRVDAATQARHQADVAAQLAAFEEHDRVSRQRVAEFEQRAKAARDRARELLLSKLSPEQRETFNKKGWFLVEGGRSKTKYRIRSTAYAGNIDVLDIANNVTYRLCVHCAHDIPLEDHLLSQKLMLELAEDSIIRLANRHAA